MMSEIRAILLVGGMGTRLRSVLPSTPKVLAPIGGKPFLELLVRQLGSQGIRNLVMCIGYGGDQIESTFGDGRSRDVSIVYSKEQTPLGTAGAIKLAQSSVHDATEFLVLNGDSLLEINFHDFLAYYRRHDGAIGAMAAVRVEDTSRFGMVHVDATNRVTRFAEKTGSHGRGLVNGGVYAFGNAIWQQIPEGPASLEKDVFPQLLDLGVYAQEQHGMFIDIGTPAEYARAQQLLSFA
jgi:NDP-sugar pyrophosphorylase family protein